MVEGIARIILGIIVVVFVLHLIQGVGQPSSGAWAWIKSKFMLNVVQS